jgi:hypothetical protein
MIRASFRQSHHMLLASINRRLGIILVRITGRLHPSELRELVSLGERVGRREGPLDIIVDFSDVSDIDLPVNYIAQRGEQAPLWPDHERILVAPQPVLHALMRLFAGYQLLHGMRKPVVVGRLEEALERYNTTANEFQPIDEDAPLAATFSIAQLAT